MKSFSWRPGGGTFCAMWWTIRSIATFTIPRWCGVATFSLPSRPTATVRPSPKEYGEWLEDLGKIRQQLFASGMNADERRRVLHELASREAFERAQSARIKIEPVKIDPISVEPMGAGAKL